MGYEILSATADRAPARQPTISVQPNGVMRVNTEATEILKELGAVRVLLLWDREKRRVAIAVAAEGDERSYKLRYDPQKNVAQFASKAAVKGIGWIATRSVRIPVRRGENMLEGTIPAEYLQGGGLKSAKAKAIKRNRRGGKTTDASGTESV